MMLNCGVEHQQTISCQDSYLSSPIRPDIVAPLQWVPAACRCGIDASTIKGRSAIYELFNAGQRYEDALQRNWAGFLPPWAAYRAVMRLATTLDRMRDAILPPQLRMMEHSMAFARTQV